MKWLLRTFQLYQNIVIALILLGFSAAGLLFGALPAVRTTWGRLNELRLLGDQVEILTQKATVLSSLDETTLRENLSLLLSAVPAEQSWPTIFATIEGAAAQAGVTLLDMSISQGGAMATASADKQNYDKKLGVQAIRFVVSLPGTPEQIKQFFSILPGVRRISPIKHFSISGARGGQTMTAQLASDALYEPLPRTIDAVTQPISPLSEKEEAVISRVRALQQVATIETVLPPPKIGPVKTNPFVP